MAVFCCFKFCIYPPSKEKRLSCKWALSVSELHLPLSCSWRSLRQTHWWLYKIPDVITWVGVQINWKKKNTNCRFLKKDILKQKIFSHNSSLTFLHIAAVNNRLHFFILSARRSESHTVGMFWFVRLIYYNLSFLKCEPSGRNTSWGILTCTSVLKLLKMALQTGSWKKK